MTLAASRQRTGPESAGSVQGWEKLAAALQYEARLMEELYAVLMRQRASVAQNDSAAIEDSVEVMGRTLYTLQTARERRLSLVRLLTGGEGRSLTDVPRLLGERVPQTVLEAKARIQKAASDVSREAAINQHVIRRSLDAGEAFIQLLFSDTGSLNPVYDVADGHGNGNGNGKSGRSAAMLVNRRA